MLALADPLPRAQASLAVYVCLIRRELDHMRWELLVNIGIGLPNPVPNTPGDVLVDWAQRAEAAGFSGLVTIDRIAYPSYDSLTSLAAAAGATKRISLMTNILLAPIYPPVLLAKTAASIDQIQRLLLARPGSRRALGRLRGHRSGLPSERPRVRQCPRCDASRMARRGASSQLGPREPDTDS